ncbi:hypothetical protein NKR23_g11767 [Pleurostoma richardsiae]|uniref:Uncharacterized protein n=1 Tax=Pleurostoma richardsiae TaxID=41990 RepID=A0AA38R751_9PEZI|nr:hypothetical protein NKR23_g11767 [Pleurostoma richardsiae]
MPPSSPRLPHEFISFPPRIGQEAPQPAPPELSPVQRMAVVLHVLQKSELASSYACRVKDEKAEIQALILCIIKDHKTAEEFEQCLWDGVPASQKLTKLIEIAKSGSHPPDRAG